jgi:hypothetical protein
LACCERFVHYFIRVHYVIIIISNFLVSLLGFAKKLDALAKTKGNEVIRPWIKSIVNHIYWYATSTPAGEEETIVANWLSLLNHVQNVHEGHGELYPKCIHETPDADTAWLEPRKLCTLSFISVYVFTVCYLFTDTAATIKLEQLVRNTNLLKGIRKLSPLAQTYSIEAHNSLVVHFAPKNLVFGFHAMEARLVAMLFITRRLF